MIEINIKSWNPVRKSSRRRILEKRLTFFLFASSGKKHKFTWYLLKFGQSSNINHLFSAQRHVWKGSHTTAHDEQNYELSKPDSELKIDD